MITQHATLAHWVHLPCRKAPLREGNAMLCLICRKVILEGGGTINRGRRRGVRHLAWGKVLPSCPYIGDLTDSVETEAPVAIRNEDLFPADGRGHKLPPLLLCILLLLFSYLPRFAGPALQLRYFTSW